MRKKKIASKAQCECVNECNNNSCIFRLQAVYGLGYFCMHEGFDLALDKAGVHYAEYPSFELTCGAAGVAIICTKFVEATNE